MNQKELNEIRRHLTLDKNNIRTIYGCYVNSNKEIISYLDESMGLMAEFEAEKYLSFLKKVLSGGLGKSLTDIVFDNEEVQKGDSHRLLTQLWESALTDSDAREELYQKIIETLDFQNRNYLILLACDNYDVPRRGVDGQIMKDASETMFSYFLCCVCPVKDGKPALGYAPMEQVFKKHSAIQLVGAPEMGFMFPAFDERAANLYGALLYSKDHAVRNYDFISAVFGTEDAPLAPDEQKAVFCDVLEQTLAEDCSLDVMQDIHSHLRSRMQLHKESKDPEAPQISAREVSDVLRAGGVPEEKVNAFQEQCDERFGESTALHPGNIMESKKFQIETPNVKISIDPEFTHVVRTKVINGNKYILIPANGGVEVNGVPVEIAED